jgi:hypothetical protein
MNYLMKPLAVVAILGMTLSAGACQRKEDTAKPVKTERVNVAPPVAAKVTVESLDRRVSDIERRMAVARKQYAKDKEDFQRRFPQ